MERMINHKSASRGMTLLPPSKYLYTASDMIFYKCLFVTAGKYAGFFRLFGDSWDKLKLNFNRPATRF